MKLPAPSPAPQKGGFLRRLARDRTGNTLAIMAAGLIPLVAMVGGAVDMSRAYLASSRLQQACDSGVLAARKYLGSSVAVDNKIPADVATIGTRFFNVNYRDGEYSTTDRTFNMFLESDYAVTGEASVKVPAIVMQMFGTDDIDIAVNCRAELSTSNVDIMMALDVTGSMRHTNAGDTLSRIDSLKATIRNFYAKVEASKSVSTTTRYGFVPYNANVNVGHLLEDDWVVDEWDYQSREVGSQVANPGNSSSYWRNTVTVSGSRTDWVLESTYKATFSLSLFDGIGYECKGTQPANTLSSTTTQTGAATVEVQTDPAAILSVQPERQVENGAVYRTVRDGSTCRIESQTSNNFIRDYEKVTEVPSFTTNWKYKAITTDVSNWRDEVEGCIEERATYEISDYSNVDLTKALDLDLDLVPTAGDSDTQWRPMYKDLIFGRSMKDDGSGSWTKNQVNSTESFSNFGNWWMSDCPPRAQKLAEMTSTELDNYLATLNPYGSTYHDIGMIWAGRLLSPTGIFASENADTAGKPKSRHLIWMTDGQTEPYDTAYNAYGLEPLDRRRWNSDTSTLTLAQVVENRFSVACEQVKNKNITVWVVAFGTTMTDFMKDCAGEGRYFEAANASELDDAFTKIADSLSDLRITK